MRFSAFVRVLLSGYLIAAATPAAFADGAIAGLRPDARPAGAPVLSAVFHDDAWLGRALFGVEPPAPDSLRWLADQGAWFTPFAGPGMTGPYDIRGWHAVAVAPAQ